MENARCGYETVYAQCTIAPYNMKVLKTGNNEVILIGFRIDSPHFLCKISQLVKKLIENRDNVDQLTLMSHTFNNNLTNTLSRDQT